jgi:hypothetical protein
MGVAIQPPRTCRGYKCRFGWMCNVMGSEARIPGAAMEILLLLNRKWEPSESG